MWVLYHIHLYICIFASDFSMGYNLATTLWDMGKFVILHALILGNATIAEPEVTEELVETRYFVVWSSIALMHISVQILCQQKYVNDIQLTRARIIDD